MSMKTDERSDAVDMGKLRRALRVVCVLLIVSCVFSLIDMFLVIHEGRGLVLGPAEIFVMVTSLADVLVRLHIVLSGHALVLWKGADNSELVNQCQSYAIAAAGLCVVDSIVDALADQMVSPLDVTETIVFTALIFVYYRIVTKMERTTFWDGIRGTTHPEPYLSVGGVATEYSIDQDSRLLRSARADERPGVVVLTPDEFLERVPVRIVQQVMHSLRDVRRSSCLLLGDVVIGNMYISEGVQRAAGFEASGGVGFSYLFIDGQLLLSMKESGPERAFLAQVMVDQFLDKSTELSLLPEMIVMITARVSEWIGAYRGRLERLESNLRVNVSKMPRGFSEFISDARRELADVQSFCRQTGDMLEDLTDVTQAAGFDRASMQCAVVARQVVRLAQDVEDVRDLAGEIRSGYQERIEVRQNNVMSVLTIVETVFTPLALVTGWYGMNFINMPELNHPDAYFIVAGILIFLIALEFAVFKRRRWF